MKREPGAARECHDRGHQVPYDAQNTASPSFLGSAGLILRHLPGQSLR